VGSWASNTQARPGELFSNKAERLGARVGDLERERSQEIQDDKKDPYKDGARTNAGGGGGGRRSAETPQARAEANILERYKQLFTQRLTFAVSKGRDGIASDKREKEL